MKKSLLLVLALLVSCASAETPRPTTTPTGAPTIEPGAVADHAAQFEDELAERVAGSQQEFAAATYITAHLQQAGYVVEFDAVPVANTVRSTNVVALPPSAVDPEYLVAVAYDNAGDGKGAESVAVFLELARALRAAHPEHSVEFIAMGAENVDIEGGHLGSRRMIRVLQDRDLDPRVIEISGLDSSSVDFFAEGSDADALMTLADAKGEALAPPQAVVDIFERAGFEATLVSGNAEEVATVLLGFLESSGR